MVHPRAVGRKAYSSWQEPVQQNSALLNLNQATPMILKDETHKHKGLGRMSQKRTHARRAGWKKAGPISMDGKGQTSSSTAQREMPCLISPFPCSAVTFHYLVKPFTVQYSSSMEADRV